MAERAAVRSDPVFDLAVRLREDAKHLALATEYAGRRWHRIHYWLGGPAAVAAALAGASALQSNASITAVFAIASAVLASLITWLDPGGTAGSFLQTSRQYASVASRIDTLLRLELGGEGGERRRKAAKTQLLELQEELHRVRDGSPEVPAWALEATRRVEPQLTGLFAPGVEPGSISTSERSRIG